MLPVEYYQSSWDLPTVSVPYSSILLNIFKQIRILIIVINLEFHSNLQFFIFSVIRNKKKFNHLFNVIKCHSILFGIINQNYLT